MSGYRVYETPFMVIPALLGVMKFCTASYATLFRLNFIICPVDALVSLVQNVVDCADAKVIRTMKATSTKMPLFGPIFSASELPITVIGIVFNQTCAERHDAKLESDSAYPPKIYHV